MGILPLKKRVNRDKCSFTTKQRMFGVFAIDEILRYRGTRFLGSRTLCHPVGWYCQKLCTGLSENDDDDHDQFLSKLQAGWLNVWDLGLAIHDS